MEVFKYAILNLDKPKVTDNSGSVYSLTSDYPIGGVVTADMNVTWTARDFHGNNDICTVIVKVTGNLYVKCNVFVIE